MFCSNCGKEIMSNQNFCSKCGNKITPALSQAQSLNNITELSNNKKAIRLNMLTSICLVIIIVLVVALDIVIVSNLIPKRVAFDLNFNKTDVQEFMGVVCKNANAEKVYVEKVKFYEYLGHDCIYAYISVKPKGKAEETVTVEFNNYEDSDEIYYISLYYNNNDTENEHTCTDIIVSALENSFCGKSNAIEYTSQFATVRESITDYNRDTRVLADYTLNNEASIQITCTPLYGSPAKEWSGRVCFYKNKEI